MIDEAWFIPGGAVVDDSRKVKLRLRPPPTWLKLTIEIPRCPPSMNDNSIRSNWRGFQEMKKSWQTEIETMLMVQQAPRRGYVRAMAGAFMRFQAAAARRDKGNYAYLFDKALGDALDNFGAIPDDDSLHYYFGGVEIESDRGPDRTLIWVYLQPKEDLDVPAAPQDHDQEGGHQRGRRRQA